MDISIRQPLAFSEIGRKDNQEDCIYPAAGNLTSSQRFFILCDGMGGHEHGEVASKTVSSALGQFFETHQVPSQDGVADYFNQALSEAYDALDSKDTADSVKKMGTTMTCILFHDGGYMAAHIGDSRIYHVRPSNVSEKSLGFIYRSSDHSLVNSLLMAGEITAEEARTFPQKNVITRAMQPNQGRRSKADIYSFSDVQPGDYFFMCCDGVLENLTDERLGQILSDPTLDDEGKIAAIKAECDGRTRDNYTCILVPVESVSGADQSSSDVFVADVECDEPDDDTPTGDPAENQLEAAEEKVVSKSSALPSDHMDPANADVPKPKRSGSTKGIWVLGIGALILAIIVVLLMRGIPKSGNEKSNTEMDIPANLPEIVDDKAPEAVPGVEADDSGEEHSAGKITQLVGKLRHNKS